MEVQQRKNGKQEKYFRIYLISSLRIPGYVINNSMLISNKKLCLQEPRAPVFLLTKQRSLTDRQQVCLKDKTKSGKVMQFHTNIYGAYSFHISYKQESHDALLKCLTEDKRFEKNRPAVACIVYKSLLHWRSLEAEKTHIFDKITHAFRSSIEVVFYKKFSTLTKIKEFQIKHHHFNLNVITHIVV